MIRVLSGVMLSAAAMLAWAWACWNPLLSVVQEKGIIQPIVQQHGALETAEQGEGGTIVSTIFAEQNIRMTYSETLAGWPQWAHWGVQFGQFLLVAFVAALLLKMAGLRSYFARVLFVVLLGVFASAFIDPRSLMRGSESWELPAYASVFHLGCTLIMGLLLAAFVTPRHATMRVPVSVR